MAFGEAPFIFHNKQTGLSKLQLTDYLVNRTSCYHLDNVTDKILCRMLLKYITEATMERERVTDMTSTKGGYALHRQDYLPHQKASA